MNAPEHYRVGDGCSCGWAPQRPSANPRTATMLVTAHVETSENQQDAEDDE